MLSDLMSFLKELPFSSRAGDFLPGDFGALPDMIQNFLAEMNTGTKVLGVGISLVLALLCCFFGYRFAKLFMSISGFIAGALIGYFVATQLLQFTGFPIFLCTLLGGILLAMFAFWVYVAGIFILCFFLAFMAAASLLPFTGDIQFFLSTLFGLIIACLAIKFMRPVIIVTSAVVGGSSASGLILTMKSLMAFAILNSLPSKLILTVVICVLGIVVQFVTTKEKTD